MAEKSTIRKAGDSGERFASRASGENFGHLHEDPMTITYDRSRTALEGRSWLPVTETIRWPGGGNRCRLFVVVALVSLVSAACAPAAKSTTPPFATSSTMPISTPTTTATATATTGPTLGLGPYLALWPFSTLADVQSWQRANQSGGHQPWHLDAGSTALDFTQYFLGYNDVNIVVGTTYDAAGAHVAVGYRTTSSVTSPAAVIHLVRWGTGSEAPWEVVGTDDTTFSLTTPAYGTTVSSPLRVGGTITGADESISVTVHQNLSVTSIGSWCCLPAGGTASPWSATVSFANATEPVLTVAAATGGHIQSVERFTVTGVRAIR